MTHSTANSSSRQMSPSAGAGEASPLQSSDRHCTCKHTRKRHRTPTEECYDDSCRVKGCRCEGFISPGPRTTVRLRAANEDGKPHFQVRAAVCHTCGDWATKVGVSKETNFAGDAGADHFDEFATHSEERILIRYGCDEHFDDILGSVCDDGGGSSSNVVGGVLELALEVESYADMVFREERNAR